MSGLRDIPKSTEDVSWQCFECRAINFTSRKDIEKAKKEHKKPIYVCGKCGLVYDSDKINIEENSVIEWRSWLDCLPYKGSERKSIPLGHIPPRGNEEEKWIDSDGMPVTLSEFRKKIKEIQRSGGIIIEESRVNNQVKTQ